jgi:hypothetical protein
MSDDLEALRKAVEAFGRRKNDLSEHGRQALLRVGTWLKLLAELLPREHEDPRNPPLTKMVREQLDIDLAFLQADMDRAATRKEEEA